MFETQTNCKQVTYHIANNKNTVTKTKIKQYTFNAITKIVRALPKKLPTDNF